jgi:hypothetical protein
MILNWKRIPGCVLGDDEARDGADCYRRRGTIVSCTLADGRRGIGDSPEEARAAALAKPEVR